MNANDRMAGRESSFSAVMGMALQRFIPFQNNISAVTRRVLWKSVAK